MITVSEAERAQITNNTFNWEGLSEHRFNIVFDIQEIHHLVEYSPYNTPKTIYLRPLTYGKGVTRYGFWTPHQNWIKVDPFDCAQKIRDFYADALDFSSQAS